MQKQEMRRLSVSEEAVDAPPAEAAEGEEAEAVPVKPKKTPTKSAAPKASSKKDAPVTAIPAKKAPSKPSAEAVAAEAPVSKGKKASDAPKRPPPGDEPSSKRAKTSSKSNGKAPAPFGLQLDNQTLAKLKAAESRIPPKVKTSWMSKAEDYKNILSSTETFKIWLSRIADWVKNPADNAENINIAVLAIDFICVQHGIKQLQFGLVESRLAAVRNSKTFDSRIAASLQAYKVLGEHASMLEHLQKISESETTLLEFLHSAVASDTVLGEPFNTLLTLSGFKLTSESADDAYLKSVNPLMPLAYCVLQGCEELWQPQAADAEEQPAEEEEEAAFELF